MAIIKTFDTPHGIPTTYHRIVKAEMEFDRGVVIIQTAVFFSSEARAEGKKPVWNEYVSVPLNAMEGDFRKSLYDLLKNYYGSYLKDGQADEQNTTPVAVVTNPEAFTDPLPVTPADPEVP